MDKSKLEKVLNDELVAGIAKKNAKFRIVNPVQKPNFSRTGDGSIGDILKQRHGHRKILFRFATWFVSITTSYVLAIVTIQAYLNFHAYKVSLVDPATLKIIITGIFVQFISLLGIITRSIWNDKPYLDAGTLRQKKPSED